MTDSVYAKLDRGEYLAAGGRVVAGAATAAGLGWGWSAATAVRPTALYACWACLSYTASRRRLRGVVSRCPWRELAPFAAGCLVAVAGAAAVAGVAGWWYTAGLAIATGAVCVACGALTDELVTMADRAASGRSPGDRCDS